MEAKTETMLLATKENILESIISSYEVRIQMVEAFFEATHQVFQDFQDSLLNTRQEREKINNQLRENLARNESLRKKDFDRMMNIISLYQEQSEQEIRKLSKEYLGEQTKLAQQLREGLRNFKDALTQGQAQEVEELQTLIKGILSKQDESKIEVTSKLKEFQQGQQQTSRMLKDLLARGKELRIRDFKAMLTEFKKQRKERIACQERRCLEVSDMLGEFRAKRMEAERNRLVEQRET
jgi:PIN domain nuclease of toxin-antitoxin system/soluble cytochrome b562